MPRSFLYGTQLQEMEQIMMAVPDFSKRGKAVALITNYNSSKLKISCDFCLYLPMCKKDDGKCSILHERFQSNAVVYEGLIESIFKQVRVRGVKKRIFLLAQSFDGKLFSDTAHQKRFERMVRQKYYSANATSGSNLAIIYLLTAQADLSTRIRTHIFFGTIELKQMSLRGIDTNGYAFYQTARTIGTGKEYIHMDEIADQDLIDNNVFKVIMTALLIARYGGEVFGIRT